MSKKQTAVDWLIDKLKQYDVGVFLLKLHKEEIEQAKEMDKNNIINAAARGFLAMPEKFNLKDAKEFGKQYYNNNYDNNNNKRTH
jgi:hypothetical protein